MTFNLYAHKDNEDWGVCVCVQWFIKVSWSCTAVHWSYARTVQMEDDKTQSRV